MTNKPPKKIYAKYAVESEGRDVHGRFATAYNEASKGKQGLLAQCVAGGWLLRECGLLTLTTEICESEEYLAATSAIQRREILLGELLKLSGISRDAPVMPLAASRATYAPTPTPEPQGEPTETLSEEEEEGAQLGAEEQPPALRRGPVMRTQGTPLPQLGATTTPAAKK